MATITTRSGKGSPLTNNEVDANFTNLNTDKAELSGATFTGAITANAGVVVDNITIDGNEIDVSSGNFVLDVAGETTIDSNSSGILNLKHAGTLYGTLYQDSNHLHIKSQISDGDLKLQGVDGGSTITALTLDMSAAGAATFNNNVALPTGRLAVGQSTFTGGSTFIDVHGSGNGVGAQIGFYNDHNTGGFFVGQAGNTSGDVIFYNVANTGMDFYTNNALKFSINPTEIVSNELGADVDFRVESDGNANMLHVDGGNNGVGIGTTGTTTPLTINGGTASAATIQLGNHGDNAGIHAKYSLSIKADSTEAISGRSIEFRIGTHQAFYSNVAGTVFNESGVDADFRVESDNNANMLFVDGGNNRIGIGKSDPARTLDIHGSMEISVNTASHETFLFTTQAANDAKLMMQNASSATAVQLSANGDTFFNGGNVGIGCSPPTGVRTKIKGLAEATNLATSATSAALFIEPYSGSSWGLGIGSVTGQKQYIQAVSAAGDGIKELLLQPFGGNVGIGVSSPSTRLEVGDGVSSETIKVNAGAGWADLRLNSNSSNGGSIYWNDGADAGQLFYYHVDDSMRFHTAATERMRIDSSGNVLVGKSSASIGTVGCELRNDGYILGVNDGDAPLFLNRLSSDGDIAKFYKDGTSVGSIGVTAGSIAFGQSNTALGAFNTDRILFPATAAGGVQDNAIDLGYSGGRFKDLYLSGGVYLGGTATSNKLDDYEQGSFQMSASGVSGGVFGYGKYVKIGSLVHWQWYSGPMNVTGSGYAHLSGLPFTTSSSTGHYSTFSTGHSTYAGTATNGYLQVGGTNAYITSTNTTSSAPYVAGNPKYVMASGTYYTDD